ncbi:MAG TPA: amidohydrolase family protein [Chloroflexota bacterium]|nr:amidohydrolase family protein [Chloroflexota bacterium]
MRATLDFEFIPLIDNHCHAVVRDQNIQDINVWLGCFTEGREGMSPGHVRTTAFVRRLVARLATFFDCEPTPEAVFAARQSRDGEQLIAAVFDPTNTDTLVIDEGLPSKDVAIPNKDFTRITGVRTASLLRLELLMQDLIAQHHRFEDVENALRDELRDVRSRGFVGLKSIAAYRTGLAIGPHASNLILAAFRAARTEVERGRRLRLEHKPLLDTLLIIAFEEAARQELPVQFHTGYGDTDADMLLANPLHLRWVLENPAFRGMKTVLLHESYPYTRQAGYLCAVYDQVFMDLSYAIPYLSVGAMREFTREALGVAPTSKLLYASDAVLLPEFYWLSATDGRRVLADAITELVADGDLARQDAEAVGQAVLNRNAARLYGLA